VVQIKAIEKGDLTPLQELKSVFGISDISAKKLLRRERTWHV
jgi:hypothetical protein